MICEQAKPSWNSTIRRKTKKNSEEKRKNEEALAEEFKSDWEGTIPMNWLDIELELNKLSSEERMDRIETKHINDTNKTKIKIEEYKFMVSYVHL